MALIYFDANILFVVQLIKILANGLKLWMDELHRFLVTCSATDHTKLRKYLKDVSRQKKRLLRAYLDLLEAYKLCEKVFHLPILMLATTIFAQSLLFVQLFINVGAIWGTFNLFHLQSVLRVVLMSIQVIKNYALLIITCVTYQRFQLGIDDVEAGCTILRSNHDCPAEVRRLCKNVSRLNAHARGALSCDALAVDGALPLRLLVLLSTYTAVMLQFALL